MSPWTRRGSVFTAIRLTGRLITAWKLVIKRSLANWRLLSAVVFGVLLASAIMASTVIYFEALRDLALKQILSQHTDSELNVLIRARKGPVSEIEYRKVSSIVENQINHRVNWMLRGDPVRAGKTPTMFLTSPGQDARAGEGKDRSYIAFMPRLSEHITLVEGSLLPQNKRLSPTGEPPELEALIPIEAAELFEVGVGDQLLAVPAWDSDTPYVTINITGVFQRTNSDAEIWEIERAMLQADTEGFRTVPFHITEDAFKSVLGLSFPRMQGVFVWQLPVDASKLNAKTSASALFGLDSMNGALTNTIPGYSQFTILDDALEDYDRRIFFSKLPMFVVLILIAIVILYYVASLSALIVEDRRSEIALLRSRGANSSQILTVFALEGATIAVIAVLGGPLLAAISISLLGYTPVLDDLTGGSRLLVTVSTSAYLMSALGGVLAFVALMFPAIQASRISVTRQRQQSSRPASQPAFQRYYIDVLLLLVSIYLFRQLTEQGSVLASDLFGDDTVNQLLLALPGLVLVASAMILLRLFPAAMGLASKVLSPRLSVGIVMGLWQMARNPTHYARLSLLLILTAGLGIFASSFGATLQLSFEQRVLYTTGSDIKVQGVAIVREMRAWGGGRGRRWGGSRPTPTPTPAVWPVATPRPAPVAAYQEVPDVRAISPVHRGVGLDLSETNGTNFAMLAVEGETFSDVAWFRDDFSNTPFRSLLKSLSVSDTPPGFHLDEDARIIRIKLKPDQPRPSVTVTVRVKDVNDWYKTYTLGTLESGDWTELETTLTQPDVPLTLISIAVAEMGGGGEVLRPLQEGSILIDKISITTDGGETQTLDGFDDVTEWSVLRAGAEVVSDVLRVTGSSTTDETGVALFSWSEGPALTPRGIFYGQLKSRLPVLASEAFTRSTGYKVGEEFDTLISRTRVPVRLAGIISMFPTMTDLSEKLLVAELSTLANHVNLGASNPGIATDAGMGPNELWISSGTAGMERDLLLERLEGVSSYTKTAIADRSERISKAKADPLVEAGWKALLFLTFGAVFILSCLGYVIHAYVSFRNRQHQFAMLRTVGLSIRQLVAMLWFEQVLVIGAGMALGTWMGGRLGATIMPFLGHDDWGDEVVPPFIMQVNWGALLTTYAAMIFVFALVSLALLAFIQRISLQRVLRLGE